MITGTKVLPFVVVHGDKKMLLGPTFNNSRQGESILFGKNRILEAMAYPDVYGFQVKYAKSDSGQYEGIQVMFIAVDKNGTPLLDIAQATIDDATAPHGGIFGAGHPNQPEPALLWICCIDWFALMIAIIETMKDEPIEWPNPDDDYEPDDPLPPGGMP